MRIWEFSIKWELEPWNLNHGFATQFTVNHRHALNLNKHPTKEHKR